MPVTEALVVWVKVRDSESTPGVHSAWKVESQKDVERYVKRLSDRYPDMEYRMERLPVREFKPSVFSHLPRVMIKNGPVVELL